MAKNEKYEAAKAELLNLRALLSKASAEDRPDLKKRCNDKKLEVNALKAKLNEK